KLGAGATSAQDVAQRIASISISNLGMIRLVVGIVPWSVVFSLAPIGISTLSPRTVPGEPWLVGPALWI
ncbi:MAG: hypothetical protein ABI955_05020, partial [Nitrospirota bacterium]